MPIHASPATHNLSALDLQGAPYPAVATRSPEATFQNWNPAIALRHTLSDTQLAHVHAQAQHQEEGDAALADIRHLFEPAQQSHEPALQPAAFAAPGDAAADAAPGRDAGWWQWTAGLLAVRGVQGGLSTLVGRLVQEGIRVVAGVPQRPEEVSDAMLAAGACLNLMEALLIGSRMGLHVWRATGRPQTYMQAFRGQSAQAAALGAAGTPEVPASTLVRALSTASVPTIAFFLKAQNGLIALSHVGSDAPSKVDAYRTVWVSNGTSIYAYVREMVTAGLDAMGTVSQRSLLSPANAATVGLVYTPFAVLMRYVQDLAGRSPNFDARFVGASTASEVVHVASVSMAQRWHNQDQPISFLRGAVVENGAQAPAFRQPAMADVLDRIWLRGSTRDDFAELTQVIPMEVGAALRRNQLERARPSHPSSPTPPTGADGLQALAQQDSAVSAAPATESAHEAGERAYHAALYSGAAMQLFIHVRNLAWQGELAVNAANRRAAQEAQQLAQDAESSGSTPSSAYAVGTQESSAQGSSQDIPMHTFSPR